MMGSRKSRIGRSRDAIVREIAERAAVVTLSQLTDAAERMSPPELRGYVRALAWPSVCAEIQEYVRNGQISKHLVNDMAASALEQTVYIVTGAFASAPVVSIPTPHISPRAAA
jgi:hypothetical protein